MPLAMAAMPNSRTPKAIWLPAASRVIGFGARVRREVRVREVGGAAEQFRQLLREQGERVLAGFARRDGLALRARPRRALRSAMRAKSSGRSPARRRSSSAASSG